ncbi:MAG: hypothetical protein ACXAEX_02735 [Promethearchaeota archaeon]|jgi:hypothetical protein
MVSSSAYIISLIIYIISTIIFIFLVIFGHRRFQDKNFLTGLIVSGVLNLLPLLAFPEFYFFVGYFLSCLFGFVAGYFNSRIILGALSGAAGIFLSWLLFSILSPQGFLVFYPFYYILVYILPTTLCGAIGGLIGYKLRLRSDSRTNTEITNMKE